MSLASSFSNLYNSFNKEEEDEKLKINENEYKYFIRHTVPDNVHQIPLGHQLKVILDFEDQKQEASAFLGRDGGLEEFLSIVYTEEILFLTEDSKIANALNLLSGELSESELRQWPAWKLQELLEFLYFRVRALERSRRLTLAGSFSTNLTKKSNKTINNVIGITGVTDTKEGRHLSKLLNVLNVDQNKSTKPQKQQPFSPIPDLFHAQTRKPTWKLVYEYGVDEPSLISKKEGYYFEAGGDYSVVLPDGTTFLYVQDADLDISYYEEYFARRIHSNYLAYDETKGHIVLSMIYSDDCSRILLRTFDEDVRLKTTSPVKLPQILKNIRYWYPSLAKVKFIPVKDLSIEKALLRIEHNHVTYNYKFGVLYCKEGQTENEMFGNEHGSDDFNEFLNFIGQEITLKGFDLFKGGLDVKNDTTGTHSIYTEIYGYEIMYHVSTLLPFVDSDPQKLERKRHLGNDVVVIIFKEGNDVFEPDCLLSEFNHVFVVIQKYGVDESGETLYKLELACKDTIPQPWRPLLPNPPIFKKDDSFRQWLLTKLINAERACMNAPGFVNKYQRTRKLLFEDLASKYVPAHLRRK